MVAPCAGPARAFNLPLKHGAIEGVLEVPRAQCRHCLDDFQPAEVGCVAHRRSPVSAPDWNVQQLRMRFDKPDCGIAIISADCRAQCPDNRVRFDPLLQCGPVGETILAGNHQLSIAKTKRSGGYGRIVGLCKSWMSIAYSFERVGLAVAPLVEKFARFALWNIEMRPLRQAPRYCSHNPSSQYARGPRSSGRKSG